MLCKTWIVLSDEYSAMDIPNRATANETRSLHAHRKVSVRYFTKRLRVTLTSGCAPRTRSHLRLPTAHLNLHLAPFSITCLGTGKMPVPQENSFFLKRASCPFLTMVKHLSGIKLNHLTIWKQGEVSHA